MPGFTVTKDAHFSPSDEIYAAPGELVNYDIIAKNNGNVDLAGVVVADPMFAGRSSTRFVHGLVGRPGHIRSSITVTLRRGFMTPPRGRRVVPRSGSLICGVRYLLLRARPPLSYPTVYNAPCTKCRPAGSFATFCGNGIPDPWEVDTEFTCSPTHVMTQVDIDAGIVTNNVR